VTATSPVLVDGLAVYRRPTSTDRTRVVLVHGSMDRAAAFRKATRHLRDLDVTLYDRRGYGRSAPVSGEGSIGSLVDDLLTVVGSEPSVVVGHSLGAVIALAAAARAPEQIVAVGAFEPPLAWRPWWPAGSAGGVARSAAAAEGSAAAAEQFMRRLLGDDRWESLPDSTRRQRRSEGDALLADLAAMRTGGEPFRPAALSVPVVLGYGTETSDRHRRACHELAVELPATELVEIAGAPHGAHYSHPEPFADFVRRAAMSERRPPRRPDVVP
jgi:pimeloyl-ACP methyl ester carboxylesterase